MTKEAVIITASLYYSALHLRVQSTRQATDESENAIKKSNIPTMIAPMTLVAANVIKSKTRDVSMVPKRPKYR